MVGRGEETADLKNLLGVTICTYAIKYLGSLPQLTCAAAAAVLSPGERKFFSPSEREQVKMCLND